MIPKSNIQITDNAILKHGDAKLLLDEAVKTIKGSYISRKYKIFYVPKINECNFDQGYLNFERILNLTPIRDLLFKKKQNEIFYNIGHSLILIHENLILEKNQKIPLPERIQEKGLNVFIHGDYSIDNVCIDSVSKKLIIIDWQMTKVFGGTSTFGTPYFDLIWFLNNLYFQSFDRIIYSTRIKSYADSFLAGYIENSSQHFFLNDFSKYSIKFMKNRYAQKEKEWTIKNKINFLPYKYLLLKYLSSLTRRMNGLS